MLASAAGKGESAYCSVCCDYSRSVLWETIIPLFIFIQVLLWALSGPETAYLWFFRVVVSCHWATGNRRLLQSCSLACSVFTQDAMRSVAVFMACQDVKVAVCCGIICRSALQNHHSVWTQQPEYPGVVRNLLCNLIGFEAASLHTMPPEGQHAVLKANYRFDLKVKSQFCREFSTGLQAALQIHNLNAPI